MRLVSVLRDITDNKQRWKGKNMRLYADVTLRREFEGDDA